MITNAMLPEHSANVHFRIIVRGNEKLVSDTA